jgi:hypothetical protein
MSIQNVIAFTVGAILGAGSMYYIFKDKYVPKEEYDDLMDYCENKLKEGNEKIEKMEQRFAAANDNIKESDDDKKMSKPVVYYGYDTVSKVTEKSEMKAQPHVISDEDYYDDSNGYDKKILHYFSQDDLLTNEANEPIGIETVGEQALKRFGEFEEDVVFVRDETKETDYQVIDEHVCYYDNEDSDDDEG